MSSSVLYDRLRELTGAGLLRRDDNEDDTLTELGAGPGAAIERRCCIAVSAHNDEFGASAAGHDRTSRPAMTTE
jgi:DNA-binding HxlR family transcriptional regulator